MQALPQIADLLAQNKVVIKVQTFPFARAAEATASARAATSRGKLDLVPDPAPSINRRQRQCNGCVCS